LVLEERTHKHILLLIFTGVLMGALDIAIVGPALPAIQGTFGLGEREVVWVFSIYVLFNLLGTPILSSLSDLLGRRTIYLVAVGLFTVGSLLTALSADFWVLLLGRAIQGAGAGGIFPVSGALIRDNFPANVRGRMLGLIGAVFGVAFLIGPVLGGVLLLFSWHWLFLVNLPIGAAILIMGFRVLPQSGNYETGPFDWVGMLLLSAILTALLVGLNRVDAVRLGESLSSNENWPLLFLFILLIAFFIRVELVAANPIIPIRLFSRKQVLLVALIAVGAGIAEAAVVFVPQLLKATFAVSASAASFMLVPLVIAMAITSPIAGRCVDRIGARPVLIGGSALLTIGMLLTGLGVQILPLFYAASILIGIGLACLLGAPLRYLILNEAPPSRTATTQGTLTLLIGLGQLLGGMLMAVVAEHRSENVVNYQTAFALMSGLGLSLTLGAFLLRAREKEKAVPVSAHNENSGSLIDRFEYAIDDHKR
jgi:EmrB/QacA subfamily drug resistance transporter